IDNLDLYQADIIALTEDFNTSSVAKNIDVIKQTNKFLDDVITKLENKEILDAVDVLMNEDFSDYQFEVVNLLPSYEIEFEAVE
ncbi:MAG: hypothetical protein GYA02_01600, partial [Clostridiaceae bacterium]|nr:hypothetical protein [Clostridiaceae bacterium]